MVTIIRVLRNIAAILLVWGVHGSSVAATFGDCPTGGGCEYTPTTAAWVCATYGSWGVYYCDEGMGSLCDSACHQYCGESAEWNEGPYQCTEHDNTFSLVCLCNDVER